ncbi:MAG: hypothetical protein A2Z15_04005 [Chloroflexi bacterium RBG_16_50_11]|nr:MAG: hypothetical protein A2Z15_04005 [Chloroflexi bacterium RBG_16_50_11]
MVKEEKSRSPHRFSAVIYKAGINPCVEVPAKVRRALLGRQQKGNVPVKGSIKGFEFRATLIPVRGGLYRLYVNGDMRRGAKVAAGDTIKVVLAKDTEPREMIIPHALLLALEENAAARAAWEKLPPSHKKEILAYLNYLKTPEALERNVKKLIDRHLLKKKI